MQILSNNYSNPIPEKYCKMILQVATIEERTKGLMSFGLVEKAKEVNEHLIIILEEIKREYQKDNGTK